MEKLKNMCTKPNWANDISFDATNLKEFFGGNHFGPSYGPGTEVTYKNLKFKIWDLGGQTSNRPSWRHYFSKTKAIIYVVDSADRDRQLEILLADEKLKDAILLVMANKQRTSTVVCPWRNGSSQGGLGGDTKQDIPNLQNLSDQRRRTGRSNGISCCFSSICQMITPMHNYFHLFYLDSNVLHLSTIFAVCSPPVALCPTERISSPFCFLKFWLFYTFNGSF
ncbi:hypothetical protein niasHT_020291 [Heterodera trifolii]|uniref:ADP-ribosylation factor n=1 Tax=Heterodera trifolii TaxID=157864 RepID=A0ABD2JQN2_9BILA